MNSVSKRSGRLVVINDKNEIVYCPPDFIHHISREALHQLTQTPLSIADIMEYELSQKRKRFP